MQAPFETESGCRLCGSTELDEILAFGDTPLADHLLTAEDIDAGTGDLSAPLTLARCDACTLVQIRETVRPEVLFNERYPYFSSVSPSLTHHFRDLAKSLIGERKLGGDSLVVEAASNDGTLLQRFFEAGIPVIGIEPSASPAEAARKRGIPTRSEFFGRDLAESLRREHPDGADVFLATNVLAHVPDLNGFVAGIRTLLKPDGLAVFEVPWVADLKRHLEFDTIYHQHLCYFSVRTLQLLFARNDLHLNRVERVSVHGGSLRLFVSPEKDPDDSVSALADSIDEAGASTLAGWSDFAVETRNVCDRNRELVEQLRSEGLSGAGYGAAAKAATFLHATGIGREQLDFIADRNAFKHGQFMGGNHFPIVEPEEIIRRQPGFVLILAWNFAEEIMEQLAEYRDKRGRFLVPIPEPRLIP